MTEQIQNLPAVESVELSAVIATPVVISGNFDAVKSYVSNELQRYDVVVTADTLSDCKKLATQLNKMASEIKARGKAITDEAAQPINLIKEQIAEIVQMCLSGREKLTAQVKTFEDETRKLCEQLLVACRAELWESTGVQPEFRRTQYLDLIILTNVTGKGALTGKAKQEVQNRVNADKRLQDQTEKRLLMLENVCLKAGMIAALTRAHVETFLFADDATYQQRLDAMIASELERQRATEQRLREQRDAEQARIDEQRQREAEQAKQRALDEQAEQFRQQQQSTRVEQSEIVYPGEMTTAPTQIKPAPLSAPGNNFQQRPAPAQPAAAPSIVFGFGDRSTGKLTGRSNDITDAAQQALDLWQQSGTELGIWQKDSSGVLLVAIVTDGSVFWRAQ
ncbi:DUF1351 domain-containing protein [Flavobacterium sp.]|jgi:uncharacterized protein YaiI (UPF0178 family)|uniref:DUF1351 domain-containing protein n=1 Tax=Flavobacterium sp. TaxID=239 RepID=UPI0037C02450